jgi:sugar (pentulose or hexulose) kinase
MDLKHAIINGRTSLGIEFGSTRIKAVLIGEEFSPIASGSHDWENSFENGMWTYSLDKVQAGLQDCYLKLGEDVKAKYGVPLTTIGSIGISAMMHGYLVFDKADRQLVPFRTWRNTITEKAAAELSALFNFNIPQRWSIAHLYQAILNKEPHVKDIAFLTSLAGYVHWKLTGEKALGLDDASGLFPLEDKACEYNLRMLDQFDKLVENNGYSWKLIDLLPKIIEAGNRAGILSAAGAKMLDPSGVLQAGIPFCPPEGDAGTGMVATNSIAPHTGNISAGTSIFAMIVLEKDLSRVYPEIDIVATPAGNPVAMVHCNNCLTDLDAWIRLFGEVTELAGKIDKPALYDALYNKALEGDQDCGGLLSYNYCSGEHLTGFEHGRPLFVRLPDSRFNLANFMRNLLFSAISTLKLGMDILTVQEKVGISGLLGHGGLFKTKGVGQKLMAAALETPVTVMESAGEGGAWGMALLAAFILHGEQESLEHFLAKKVFSGNIGQKVDPESDDVRGFKKYIERYTAGLAIERTAVEKLEA